MAAGVESEGANVVGGEGEFADEVGGGPVVVGEDDAASAIHDLDAGVGHRPDDAESGELGADAADEEGAGADADDDEAEGEDVVAGGGLAAAETLTRRLVLVPLRASAS